MALKDTSGDEMYVFKDGENYKVNAPYDNDETTGEENGDNVGNLYIDYDNSKADHANVYKSEKSKEKKLNKALNISKKQNKVHRIKRFHY